MGDCCCERDKNYRTAELKVPAVVKLEMEDVAAASAQTTFGEHMETLDIMHGILQMPPGTSWQGSGQLNSVPANHSDRHA